jgi:hypothetical protein
MSDFHNKSQFLTIVLVCGTGAFLFVMRNNPLANSSLDLSAVNAAVTPLPHDTALIQPVSLKVVMLLVICFCTRAYPQSERLVSMTAPNSRLYTTICITERCEIHKAAYAVDLVDPQYAHDRKQERKTFCKVKGLKYSACSLAFG